MPIDNVSLVVSVASLISQVLLWCVLFQVVKQQGRILLRLDDLARNTGPQQLPVINTAAAAAPVGPKIGHPVENFRLPNLAGEEVSLEDYRGRRVLLVHWSPSCGFCDLIAPDLARYHAKLLEQGVNLVLI